MAYIIYVQAAAWYVKLTDRILALLSNRCSKPVSRVVERDCLQS